MPKSPAKQQKGGEGGISRLCPLLKKMLMKNGWLGFSITFLLKHFYILSHWLLAIAISDPYHGATFLGVIGVIGVIGAMGCAKSAYFFVPIKTILLKIAYDEIIFVRSKGAEAEHSRPMRAFHYPMLSCKITNQNNSNSRRKIGDD